LEAIKKIIPRARITKWFSIRNSKKPRTIPTIIKVIPVLFRK